MLRIKVVRRLLTSSSLQWLLDNWLKSTPLQHIDDFTIWHHASCRIERLQLPATQSWKTRCMHELFCDRLTTMLAVIYSSPPASLVSMTDATSSPLLLWHACSYIANGCLLAKVDYVGRPTCRLDRTSQHYSIHRLICPSSVSHARPSLGSYICVLLLYPSYLVSSTTIYSSFLCPSLC